MRVMLFAGLAEAAGSRELELPTAPATVADLEAAVRDRIPALARATFRVAVNRAYASPRQALAERDEIALIPPVSGGCT
jgi:molybdopterin converting factor subunit 1